MYIHQRELLIVLDEMGHTDASFPNDPIDMQPLYISVILSHCSVIVAKESLRIHMSVYPPLLVQTYKVCMPIFVKHNSGE